jgi:excisionase family DNA binding protein
MDQLTTKQASEILGVSRRRVIALIEQGKLKARKFSNVYVIMPKDLETVRNRKNGRPDQTPEKFVSFAEAAADYIGTIDGDDLPIDLSTNPKHMEGFGLTNAQLRKMRDQKRLTNGKK